MSEEGAQLYFFIGCLLSFFGAVAAVFFVVAVWKKLALRSWRPVTATVVESEVVWGSEGGGRKWLPRFAYEYEVGGRAHRGRRTDFFRRRTGSSARELVARHPVGSPVQVFYDPKRPDRSIMNKNLPALWILPLAALACAAFAAYLLTLPARLGH
jgi:hypothetical protein